MKQARHILFGVMLAALPLTGAQSQPSLEYAVKAAFLTKFVPFIDWPDGTFADAAAPLTLCILGTDPFGAAIDKAAAATGGGHPITIKRVASTDLLDGCQMVFAGDPSLDEIGLLRDRPVVTVTDAGMPVRGLINFVTQDNHVRFDIDEAAAEKDGLRISSKLLGLARNVTRPAP
jgi:hypothetical protein